MDFDQLLVATFGTSDLSAVPHDRLLAGVENLRARFGLEPDGEARFAIWCLLYMLGAAPDPDEAFKSEDDRAAAHDFIESIDEDDEE